MADQTRSDRLRHQQLVVIDPVVADGLRFDPVDRETAAGIAPNGRCIGRDGGQFDDLDSLFAAAAYTTAVLIICAPAAYAFARLKFPGNNILFGLLLLTVMLPSQVTLIPNFLLMRDLRFLDTFHALIWPGAANVFAVFLLRQFFMQIPQELEEAAILDGAGYFGRFRHVILPLSTNALTAMGIFVFLGHYNDLLWPFITTSSLEMRTLPVGLQILNSSYAGQYRPLVLAGAVFATVPIIIVYIIFQRRIIKGVVMTGMGGR